MGFSSRGRSARAHLFGKLTKDFGAPVRMEAGEDGGGTIHRQLYDQLGGLIEVRLVQDLDCCRNGHHLQHPRSHAAIEAIQRFRRVDRANAHQGLG